MDRHERLEDVTLDDLGRARQAWVTHSHFGILGGRGEKAAIRARIGLVKQELRRPARMTPGAASASRSGSGSWSGWPREIKVGAATPSDREELKLRVEAAVTSARAAVQDGVVPGGGAALLACVPAVRGA